MVLTDPEFESSVLISTDEGASFQKYRLTFYLLSLLFHPTEEDWALAYSHDQKVSLSEHFCVRVGPFRPICAFTKHVLECPKCLVKPEAPLGELIDFCVHQPQTHKHEKGCVSGLTGVYLSLSLGES